MTRVYSSKTTLVTREPSPMGGVVREKNNNNKKTQRLYVLSKEAESIP